MAEFVQPCSICTTSKKPVINAFLAAGRTGHWIEVQMKALGSPTKAETVRRHLERCLGGERSNASIDTAASGDFAAAVKTEALKMLQAGQLKIRTADGLQAQSLLDRRAEHAANRTLLLNITRLLVGGEPPEDLIEGEFVVLAPPELTTSG